MMGGCDRDADEVLGETASKAAGDKNPELAAKTDQVGRPEREWGVAQRPERESYFLLTCILTNEHLFYCRPLYK